MSKREKLRSNVLQVPIFLFTRIPVFLVFFVGLYWAHVLFANLKSDTTTITNSAFGVVAILSALSFSCARAVTDSSEASDRFAYAGERFFHGGLLLLSASLLKYAFLQMKSSGGVLDCAFVGVGIEWGAGVMVGVLFTLALIAAHGGVVVVNKLLWLRLQRYSDWDDLM